MTTAAAQFATWLVTPEGTRLQLTTACNRFDFEALVDYCVALANEGGEKIV